jgi:hypothetical protein
MTALRPREVERRLVYRGHADASWQLVPSAFRKGARFATAPWQTVEDWQRELGKLDPKMAHRRNVQISLEFHTLVAFFQAADEAGLSLPEDTQVIRERFDVGAFDLSHMPNTWPDLGLRSILALAQHHGLPTRLLDWTWDWRAAAFFAARDAIREKTETLAVWCLDAFDLRTHTMSVDNTFGPSAERTARPGHDMPYLVHLVTAPGATNPNLRGQKGLFTLLEIASRMTPEAHAWTPLEDLVERDTGRDAVSLYKHTLPVSEAAQLLRSLSLEGVTAATLFPGYDGVVQSLKDRWLWDV